MKKLLALLAASSLALGALAQTAAADPAAAQAAFKKADANGDGKLSKDEAAKLPKIASMFDTLDQNKDGALDLAEFSAGFTAA
ncbi:MAG: EF-hand domain-containing protein [Piscinibacter sp.]|uniref:EF-hand domain-containing protein n=1 Tax=Piscinibacter TaxID=1114981 RepID=UPI000FDEA73B|nr:MULTISPECIES: EF-hand domain-containing protein [Piscinibacter]MCW5664940.1 EF-hand domain-containing protein [Piscinibacter sp.]